MASYRPMTVADLGAHIAGQPMTGPDGSSSGSSWRNTGGSPARHSPLCCTMSHHLSGMNAGMPSWQRWPSISPRNTTLRRQAGLRCGCCVALGSRQNSGCSVLTP